MIHGLSDRRRLSRLGKVRLGVMVQGASGKAHPKATDYFVVDEVIQDVYGERPKELPILFPVDDPQVIFPQELKMYRTAGLWCAGDAQKARRWNDKGDLMEIACPCAFLDEGKCSPVATLNFLLPDVPGVGVWQLTTSNKRSIVALNSSLESFSRTFGGLAGIPFTLKLEPESLQRFDEAKKGMVKQTLHVLRLDSAFTLRQLVEWRQKIGQPVAALMPMPVEEQEDRAGDDAPLPSTVIDKATGEVLSGGPPTQPSLLGDDGPLASLRADLETLFSDAAGGNRTKAQNMIRKTCQANLGRAVEGLGDLSEAELRTLAKVMSP